MLGGINHASPLPWKAMEKLIEVERQNKSMPEENRKLFICANCEHVYCDAPVSECDCACGANLFREAWIVTRPPTKTAPIKPLTGDEILEAYKDCPLNGTLGHFVAGVRFAERYHGIGTKPDETQD